MTHHSHTSVSNQVHRPVENPIICTIIFTILVCVCTARPLCDVLCTRYTKHTGLTIYCLLCSSYCTVVDIGTLCTICCTCHIYCCYSGMKDREEQRERERDFAGNLVKLAKTITVIVTVKNPTDDLKMWSLELM